MKNIPLNRREFLAKGGSALAGLGLTSAFPVKALSSGHDSATLPHELTVTSEYSLPPLPYTYDALEPYIDAKTMQLHHDTHFAGYTRGLNKALRHFAKSRKEDDYSAIAHWQNQLAFNGAGYVLHTLFFEMMSPSGKAGPSDHLKATLGTHFGSFEAFKKHFSEAAATVQGSGWSLLGFQPLGRKLLVLQVEKHQNLTPSAIVPVLALDVWEHAYYLKYQNQRRDYINNWWNIVDWRQVEIRLDDVLKTPYP